MDTRTIQTRNIAISVLEKAEDQALADGLSSVQDAVRMFLTKYSQGEIQIGFNNEISESKEIEYLDDSRELEKSITKKRIKSYKKSSDLLNAIRNE